MCYGYTSLRDTRSSIPYECELPERMGRRTNHTSCGNKYVAVCLCDIFPPRTARVKAIICQLCGKKAIALVTLTFLLALYFFADRILLSFDSEFYSVRVDAWTDAAFRPDRPHDQPTPLPLLTLFTTFKDVPSQRLINTNTIKAWSKLEGVVPVMYYAQGDAPFLREQAEAHHWQVFEAPRLRLGIPVIKEMFRHAIDVVQPVTKFVAFANADIVFGEDLCATLQVLDQMNGTYLREHGLFVSGRRVPQLYSFLNAMRGGRLQSSLPQNLHTVAFDMPWALDYFIYLGSHFPYEDIPDFVVGKVGFDNWLATQAITTGMVTVDASFTITALHQVHTLVYKEDGWLSKNACMNRDLVDPFKYDRGRTICFSYYTRPSSFPLRAGGRGGGCGSWDGGNGTIDVYRRYKFVAPCVKSRLWEVFDPLFPVQTCAQMAELKRKQTQWGLTNLV